MTTKEPSQYAIDRFPAPYRGEYMTGADYAIACMLCDINRILLDHSCPDSRQLCELLFKEEFIDCLPLRVKTHLSLIYGNS